MDERDQVVVFEPDQRVRLGFVLGWRVMVGNVVSSRELIWQLFKRDFLAGSKQSVLGLLWILITPLVGIVSWVVMNAVGVLHPGEVGVPYPIYVLCGTTIWGMFMGFYSSAAASLTSAGGLLAQARFSHEALVAQQLAQAVIAALANLALLAAVWAMGGLSVHWSALWFPVSLLPLVLLGTGIGLIVSVFAVVVHDITKAVTTLLGLLMFATPVIYASNVPHDWLQRVIWWNPLTYLVGGARDLLLEGRIDHVSSYAGAVAFALGLFLMAWRLFFLSEQKVAERL
ncbi:MAG: ABC transporter permease [Nitrospira sp.]|nr:ABC transporter permease [Nitrospira sp.]